MLKDSLCMFRYITSHHQLLLRTMTLRRVSFRGQCAWWRDSLYVYFCLAPFVFIFLRMKLWETRTICIAMLINITILSLFALPRVLKKYFHRLKRVPRPVITVYWKTLSRFSTFYVRYLSFWESTCDSTWSSCARNNIVRETAGTKKKAMG